MKTYGLYTQRHIIDNTFEADTSLNGWYDLSFFQNYPDYALPVVIEDGDNLLTRTKEEVRPFVVTSDLTQEQIELMAYQIPTEFNLQLLTNTELADWLRGEGVREETENVFVMREASEFMGEISPEKILDLN